MVQGHHSHSWLNLLSSSEQQDESQSWWEKRWLPANPLSEGTSASALLLQSPSVMSRDQRRGLHPRERTSDGSRTPWIFNRNKEWTDRGRQAEDAGWPGAEMLQNEKRGSPGCRHEKYKTRTADEDNKTLLVFVCRGFPVISIQCVVCFV